MFQPNALHLALAASAALAMSAVALSDNALNQDDSSASLGTRGRTPAPAPAPCAADLTGDRRIDVLDMIEVLLGWGTCPDYLPYPVDDTDPSGVGNQRDKDSAGPSTDNGDAPTCADALNARTGELFNAAAPEYPFDLITLIKLQGVDSMLLSDLNGWRIVHTQSVAKYYRVIGDANFELAEPNQRIEMKVFDAPADRADALLAQLTP